MGKATDHKGSDASVRVILFKSKTLADGSHPLMVHITKDRKRKYIAVGESCHLKYRDEEKNVTRHGGIDYYHKRVFGIMVLQMRLPHLAINPAFKLVY